MPSDTYTLNFSGAEINELLALLQTASSGRNGTTIQTLLDKISELEGKENVNYNSNTGDISLKWIEL